MKKCASCTKDLPDAALHCVFCGAKQPPAPAVQQSMAKTALGYSANEVAAQLPPQAARPPAYNPPAAPAYNPPAYNPPAAPAYNPPAAAAYNPPAPYPSAPSAPPASNYVPMSAANAKTMFVQAAGPSPSPAAEQATLVPGAAYARPHPASAPPPMQGMQATVLQPQPHPVSQPQLQPVGQPALKTQLPAQQPPPYYSSQTGITRAGRVVDPWRDTLRLMMFLWGFALLAVFATPLQTQPDLSFHWKTILDGAGTARLPPLMLAAIGLLGLIVAPIPMPTAARGAIAALLGLAGIAVPIALYGLPPWQLLVPMAGTLVLVTGLIIRSQYRDAILPRLLVTFGAVGVLVPYLLPQHDAIPLVSIFKALIDQPGTAKIYPVLALGQITIVVMALLAWLPAPITGGAMLWAWLLILWSLVLHATDVALKGGIPDAITGAPNATLVAWIAGTATEAGVALGSAYLVLVGYGLAALLGRQLE